MRSSDSKPHDARRCLGFRRLGANSGSDVLDDCRTAQAFADVEQFRILFLDSGLRATGRPG
jgi:hypothetical protein